MARAAYDSVDRFSRNPDLVSGLAKRFAGFAAVVLTRCACMALILTLSAGCVSKSVSARLATSSAEREQEIRKLMGQLKQNEPVEISWSPALKKMHGNNLGLLTSKNMLERSEKLQRNQWLTLIPRPGGHLQMSKDLASISDLSGDYLSTRLIANFNIPNPFDFHARLYAAALQQQSARWSRQLDERRAYIDLYSAFMEAESLRVEKEIFQRKWKAMLYQSEQNFADDMRKYQQERDSLEYREKAHRININRLFNSPGANWSLKGGLPVISYDSKYDKLKVGEDFGKLALNLYAIQLESAILSTERIKFQQWPVFSFGLSSPPLYVSEQNVDWSGENFVLFSGVSKSLDFSDLGGKERVADAEFRLKTIREQLRSSMEREAMRLEQLSQNYGKLLRERSSLHAEIDQINNRNTPLAEVVLADLKTLFQLQIDLLRVDRQLRYLALQYLLWDEKYWKL